MRHTVAGQLRRRWPVLVLGLVISAGLLWYTFRDLHLDEVLETLRAGRYAWIIPGLVVYFLSIWFRSWRWRFLLRGSKVVGTGSLFSVVLIGYMGNNVLPLRLGEVLRAYVLGRREGINLGTSLTTAVLERLFDGLTMVLFALFGLLFVPMSPFFRRLVTVASASFFGAFVAFLLLAARPQLMRRIARALILGAVPQSLRGTLLELSEGVIVGLESLRRSRDVLVVLAVTLGVWILEAVNQWLVSFAFDLALPFSGIMLMAGVMNLLTALPSLPGYVGTFEAAGVQVLSILGVPSGTAASYVLVLHAVVLLPVTVLGAILFAREGVRWAEVWERDRSIESGGP